MFGVQVNLKISETFGFRLLLGHSTLNITVYKFTVVLIDPQPAVTRLLGSELQKNY